jgi:hypothetical protein
VKCSCQGVHTLGQARVCEFQHLLDGEYVTCQVCSLRELGEVVHRP